MIDRFDITRLEDRLRDTALQSRITEDSPDVRVLPVRSVQASPKTVFTSLQWPTLSPIDTAITWINPANNRVDRYEVWYRNSSTNKEPKLYGTFRNSPAYLNFSESIAGTLIIYVITVMKDGKRNNLKSCPTTTVNLLDGA